MRMKALVTGGAGFIGSHLVEALIRDGHTVVVIDNLSVSDANVSFIKNLGAEFHQADIINFETIEPLFKDVTVVFHLAAMNRAQRSIEQPLDANDVNVTGTLNCLEASRRHKANKFIFVSSSSVYDPTRTEPLEEDMPLKPPHPYGVGKLAGEHYTRVYYELFGLPFVTLRYFSVYGPRQLGTIDKPGVVAKFIHQAMTDTPLDVFGNGTQQRNFSYVKDVVAYTLRAAQEERAVGEVFNIAAEQEISVLELAQEVQNAVGKNVGTAHKPRPTGDPDRNPVSVSKAKRLLNYTPQYTFEQGIRETAAWYEQTFLKQ